MRERSECEVLQKARYINTSFYIFHYLFYERIKWMDLPLPLPLLACSSHRFTVVVALAPCLLYLCKKYAISA